MGSPNWDLKQIKADIFWAERKCFQRGLLQSAKWMSELLGALKNVDVKFEISSVSAEELSEDYLLGKNYFYCKEFDRAAHFTQNSSTPLVRFLHLYSRYCSAEKKKCDDSVESGSHFDPYRSRPLTTLKTELHRDHHKLDGFMLYLYGVILKKLGLFTEAVSALVEAINQEPMHWGAWLELATLVRDKEMLSSLTLPDHWIKQFFLAHAYLDLQLNEDALTIYRSLRDAGFDESTFITAQIAIAHHNMRDVDQAVQTFQNLQKKDPFRLDNMDTYSNLLYVKEMRVELSHLAHTTCEIDKYRVETCCVIGNYYSLRAQHEKAVLYFQRALKLNPNYLSAWTLMGHEYMELKNTAAAIQAYRQAIQVNRRDYRAWYGLGQTYEIVKMPYYCVYYYHQAQQLRPHDSRMLVALGDSFEKLNDSEKAKKLYWKAHCVGDIEGMALVKLAKLYEKSQQTAAAAAAYTEYLRELEAQGLSDRDEQCQAQQFLANYHLKQGKLDLAYQHAVKCMDFNETREGAKALLRQIADLRAKAEPQPMGLEEPLALPLSDDIAEDQSDASMSLT